MCKNSQDTIFIIFFGKEKDIVSTLEKVQEELSSKFIEFFVCA